MEPFDPRTYLLLTNLLGVLCALVLWVQARSFPKEIEGLGDWAKAVALIAFASGLSGLRGIWPSLLTWCRPRARRPSNQSVALADASSTMGLAAR